MRALRLDSLNADQLHELDALYRTTRPRVSSAEPVAPVERVATAEAGRSHAAEAAGPSDPPTVRAPAVGHATPIVPGTP